MIQFYKFENISKNYTEIEKGLDKSKNLVYIFFSWVIFLILSMEYYREKFAGFRGSVIAIRYSFFSLNNQHLIFSGLI